MKNLMIRTKLFIGFGTLIVALVIVAGVGIFTATTINTRYSRVLEFNVRRYSMLQNFSAGLMDVRRITSQIALNSGDYDALGTLDRMEAELTSAYAYILESMNNYRHAVDNSPNMTPEQRRQANNEANLLQRLTEAYINDVVHNVIRHARLGERETAVSYIVVGLGMMDGIYAQYDSMMDGHQAYMDYVVEDMNDTTRTFRFILIAIAIAVFAIGVIAALIISNMIAKPITSVVNSLGELSQGKLNVNLKVDSKDEVGQLNQAAIQMVTTLQNLMSEMDHMATEQAKGQLDVFIDVRKFQNSFADVAEQINVMMKAQLSLQQKVVDVFSKIADGAFDTQIEKLPGQLIFINEAVETMRTNITSVSDAINDMIEAAADKGDMSFKIDTKGFHDGWLLIMQGLNNICEEINKPVAEVREVMGRLINGDFSRKVEGKYNGDFKAIADAVNGTIDALNSYISEMSSSLSALASGDLTRTITREYVGDFSEIKRSINHITETFYKTVSEITAATDQVLSGAKQISQSAMDLANGAQSQASSVEELNASVDLINQQTRTNAESAELASELSTRSTANAQEGNEAMGQMLDAMSGIRESSNSISKIIKTITDIAFQTNLLSLNASVEAARAGEHGRGFSVVADEVRSLATRSTEAANETTELIQGSVDRVETGGAIASSTAVSLDAIVSSANEMGDVIAKISEASREQADAIDQISIGLQQISNVVQSNSAVSEETAAAAEELNSQAEILQQLVAYFKL